MQLYKKIKLIQVWYLYLEQSTVSLKKKANATFVKWLGNVEIFKKVPENL